MTRNYDQYSMVGALRKALPHIRLYRGKLFVVKTGGAIFEKPAALEELIEQLAVLNEVGIRVVLVHGGGVQTTQLATRLGVETKIVEGRRITDEETLSVSTMTLNGSMNTQVLAACRAQGLRAAGISGVDAALVQATKRPIQQNIDYGLVGDIQRIDGTLITALLNSGIMPVVSPLSSDDKGQVLNINADTVAARLAAELGAEKLIFVSSEIGLLEKLGDPASLVSYTDINGLEKLRKNGAIDKGMLPKTSAATEALLKGVRRVHMVSFDRQSSLLVEIFTNEGSGTMIVKDTAELLPTEQQT